MENFACANWVEADRILKKHYETVFEIFDHRPEYQTEFRPWSGQAALTSNTFGPDLDFKSFIIAYSENKIYDVLKMSFPEYLELSKEHRNIVDEECKRQKSINLAAAEAADLEMKNRLNAGNKQPSPGARPQHMRGRQ